MRRALMLLPLLAIAAGCEKEPAVGGVKVTVTYSGFLPKCIRVTARDSDDAPAEARSKDLVVKDEHGTDDTFTVGVLAPEGRADWGPSVTVEAQAFEKGCDGTAVVTQTDTVKLEPGKSVDTGLRLVATDSDRDGFVSRATGGSDCQDTQAAINPDAQERCNDVDDNCSGQTDEGFRLGEACTEGDSCPGTWRCAPNGQAACADIPEGTMAYPDTDGDRYGDRNAAAVRFCGAVPSTHVLRNDDCDDTRNNVFPGAQELCDERDNNCNGQPDEGYAGLGQSCVIAATQCSGQNRCAPSGTSVTCVASENPRPWYVDADGDGYGVDGGEVVQCPQPPGRVSLNGDCNDGNPFNRPGLSEACDGIDNNCDGQPEVAATTCPAGAPIWADRTVGAADQTWRSVSSWTQGGVWAVGDNNRRAVLTPSSTTFNVSDSGCGSSNTAWNTVWADPQNNGRAYLGSGGGRLAHQDTGVTDCTQVTTTTQTPPNLSVFGLVGIRNASTLGFYGASASSANEEGAAFFWNGGTTVTFNAASNPVAYVSDIHGRTRDTVFLVGGYDGTTSLPQAPHIYRFNPNTSRWEQQLALTATGSQLKGVWVVNDRVAFAVGNAGTVFRWNGTQWSRLSFPNTESLTSVIAFGASLAYATSSQGHIYRYDGTTWQQVFEVDGVQLFDITGTGPADLWVAGGGGHIYHWPQWPQ